MLDTIKPYLMAASGLAMALWGSLDLAIQVLLVMMMLDLMSGVFASGIEKKPALDSTVGYLGWRRKAMTVVVVMGVAALQGISPHVNGDDIPATQVVAAGFAVIEFFSLVENAGRAGVRMPGFVADAFERLRAQVVANPNATHTEER